MSENRYLMTGMLLNERYEIFNRIANGGFGITYRAFDHRLNRFVVVKEFFVERWMERATDGRECLVRALMQEEKEKLENCRINFRREAKIMEELKDIPYLSRIQEYFSENNTEYIVMKLLTGDSMTDYVKKVKKISADEMLFMTEQILTALAQMHEKGILHRDICPNNLIRTEDGDLFLIDFGSATSCDRTSELWSNQVFTNKTFEAPEHLSFSRQGPWTDIYSLCASIVYLLTGEGISPPKERERHDLVPQILIKSGLSARQQNVLMKGLSIACEQRYASAAELKTALCKDSRILLKEWCVGYAARTDIGARAMNQDNLTVDGLFCYGGQDFETQGQRSCDCDTLHLAAVCDGVSVAHSGELASRAAIQALTHFIEQYGQSELLPERLLDELLDQMNEKMVTLGEKIGTAATTLALLLWKGNLYWSVNIGDSSVYRLRKRKMKKLSVPHTKAYVRLMSGKQPQPHDFHTLMNYLGKKRAAGSQMAAIRHGHLQKGDTFLLCSDGVTDSLRDEQLRHCLLMGEKKGIKVLWKNLDRTEKKDNCTAVILKFM